MATIGTFAAFSSRGYSSSSSTAILPTGGNYVIDNSALGKRVHVFTSPGNFTIPSNATLNSKWAEVEILLVGGGGSAGSGQFTDFLGGGGGGGGSVVYDSAFRLPKGFTLSVTVAPSGDSSYRSAVPGLPAAMTGGNGGDNLEYSKGWPGGTGGGGSWHNGSPNGPAYSVSNPGWTYGNTGPSAPTNTKYFMPVVLNNPSETASNVANAISRTWSTQFHSEGNGQYGCTTNAPDSTKGLPGSATIFNPSSPGPLVDGTYYSAKAFRMRGGGGASFAGALGGQGVLTDFTNFENGSYQWITCGGHGETLSKDSANTWATTKTYPYVQALRDSGVFNGTYYAPGTNRISSPSTVNWDTLADSLGSGSIIQDQAGMGSYGSGGGYATPEIDGERGILILRYDLNSFPGGSPSASANVFGGSIYTSANGRFRYHLWTGDSARGKGSSANSETYTAFDDDFSYRLRSFGGDGSGDYSFYSKKSPGANTSPFYFYRDVPSFTVQYFMIGGGGASGTKGRDLQKSAWIIGGGGSGGMQIGAFATPSAAPNEYTMGTLPDSLANASTTSSSNFDRMQTGSFSHRPGYVEVRANSMLNDRLNTNQYVDTATNSTDTLSREASTVIRIRGSDNSKARLLQRDNYEQMGGGFLGNNGTHENPDEQYYIINNSDVGSPWSESWGTSINLTGYDHYFYSGYVKARAGRRGRLFADQYDEGSAPTDGTADSGPQTFAVNRTFTLGTMNAGRSSFQASVATGTHPATGESYYNAIRFEQPIRKWSKASDDLANDRWTNFYSRLNTYNVSTYDNDVYGTPTPSNPDAVTRINRSFTQCGDFTPPGGSLGYYDRRIHFSYANSAGTVINNKFSNIYGTSRQAKIQYIEECCNPSNPSFGKRRFQYLDWWGDDDNYLTISGDWKVVSVADAQIFTYTNEDDSLVRTYTQVWKRSLRRIVIRQLFAYDVDVGEGGKGAGSASGVGRPEFRRRSGGTTSIHAQNSTTIPSNWLAGGGGAGGWGPYDANPEPAPVSPFPAGGSVLSAYRNDDGSLRRGVGIGTNATDQGTLAPAGAAGGPSWYMETTTSSTSGQSSATPGSTGGTNGAPSNALSAAAGGGGGGASINNRDWDMGAGLSSFLVGGATRGTGTTGFSYGRQTRRSLFDNDSSHGGRGYFGGTSDWSYGNIGSVTLNSVLTYYYLNINQFPHNAIFASGGGGGAGGNGGDGSSTSGGTGGNGADGAVYSLVGYPAVYGAGGGGFGRRINGSPGSSMPADPSTVSPVGSDGPAYTPYGIGGGWSPGMEEGGGADGGVTKYYPGSGPWPAAYPVSAGQAHMDAMRYWYGAYAPFGGTIPSPQRGNVGTSYSGRQGVVIIAYNASPYFT